MIGYGHFTYLLLNILSAIPPILFGFDKRVKFAKKWKILSFSIPTVAISYVLFDILFTKWGIWSFNAEYTLHVDFFSLPIEEVFFFFTIPFACMFIYENCRTYIQYNMIERLKISTPSRLVTVVLVLLYILFMIASSGKLYSQTAFSYTLLITLYSYREKWFPYFMVAYALHLLPFFIVNGILTALPVVLYTPSYITGVHIYTIPIEDLFYSYGLFLSNVKLKEHLST